MSPSEFYAKRFQTGPNHTVTDKFFNVQIVHDLSMRMLDVMLDLSDNANWTDDHMHALARSTMALIASAEDDMKGVSDFVYAASRPPRDDDASQTLSANFDRTVDYLKSSPLANDAPGGLSATIAWIEQTKNTGLGRHFKPPVDAAC